jgi:hypothetical protein
MKRTWTIIGVRDVPASFKWYQSLFGFGIKDCDERRPPTYRRGAEIAACDKAAVAPS